LIGGGGWKILKIFSVSAAAAAYTSKCDHNFRDTLHLSVYNLLFLLYNHTGRKRKRNLEKKYNKY
jgi:hypothetical protein